MNSSGVARRSVAPSLLTDVLVLLFVLGDLHHAASNTNVGDHRNAFITRAQARAVGVGTGVVFGHDSGVTWTLNRPKQWHSGLRSRRDGRGEEGRGRRCAQ